jgi:protein TonB
MQDISFPLQRLGLDGNADERDVRRAYARELKQIDQENDPTGFQVLREAYEAALSWARRSGAQAPAPGRAAATPPKLDFSMPRVPVQLARVAEPAAGQADTARENRLSSATANHTAHTVVDNNPQADAAAVFGDFEKHADSLVQLGDAHSELVWQKELQRCLDDQRLFNITARELFEHQVAALLVDGWKPGHEALLVAAGKIFDWMDDPRRLMSLGYAGAILNRAVEERIVFDGQSETVREKQRNVIARLRDADLPDHRELLKTMSTVERLTERFPTWIPIVTSTDNIQRWRELFNQIPEEQRSRAFQLPKEPAPAKKSFSFTWRVWGVLFAVMTMARIIATVMETPKPAPLSESPRLYFSQTAQQYSLPPLQVTPTNIGDRIKSKIRFSVPPDLKDNPAVEYEIRLYQDGTLLGLHKVKPSGLPGFDEAVANAIRLSAPFPPDTPRTFVLASRPR